MKYRTIGHGKNKRVIPISDPHNSVRTRNVSIPMKNSGSLKKFGFSLKETFAKQHEALAKAVMEYGKGKVMDKLNALRVMFKNKDPDYSEELESDMQFVRRE